MQELLNYSFWDSYIAYNFQIWDSYFACNFQIWDSFWIVILPIILKLVNDLFLINGVKGKFSTIVYCFSR